MMIKFSKEEIIDIRVELLKSSGRLDYKSEEYKKLNELIKKLESLEKEMLDFDNVRLEVE
jgi:uncharacterized protein YydD (DUF2326 family)